MAYRQGEPTLAKAANALRESLHHRKNIAQRAVSTVPLGEQDGGGAVNAVFTLDSQLRITYLNKSAEHLYGCTAASVLGRPIHEVIRTADVLGHPSMTSVHADVPGIRAGAGIHVTPAGNKIPVHVSLVPLPSTSSSDHFVVIVRDDRAHAALVSSLAQQRDFVTFISELSARFSNLGEDDVDNEIEFWLQRLAETLNVERSCLARITPDGQFIVTHTYTVPDSHAHVKTGADERLPWLAGELTAGRIVTLSRIPDDLPPHAVAEREYLNACGMRAGIGIPITIAGSLVCALTCGAFRQPRDWPHDVVARLQLIGEVFANAIVRKQAKTKLDQKQRELAHLGRVAAMAELTAVIAHELDQPLTAIASNAQAIRQLLETPDTDPAEVDGAITDVIDAAMLVSEIVLRERQLIKKSESCFLPLDLNEAVREVELFIRAEARQDCAKLSFELQPGLPKVMADRVQLEQVILNLTRNALQAMSQTPRERRLLQVRTSVRSGHVELAVTDAGPDVDELQVQKMFEPFFTTKPDGLGMGLAISKTIVESHNGRIWAARNPGGGLTMYLSMRTL